MAGAAFEDGWLVVKPTTASASSRLYQRAPGREHSLRVDPRQPWIVTQRVDDPDVERAGAQVAVADLAQGATGLSLVSRALQPPSAMGCRQTRPRWSGC